MHNTATRSSLLRLLRLSQPMLQLILSTPHRLPQCLFLLHPLLQLIGISIQGNELLARRTRLRYQHNINR